MNGVNRRKEIYGISSKVAILRQSETRNTLSRHKTSVAMQGCGQGIAQLRKTSYEARWKAFYSADASSYLEGKFQSSLLCAWFG